MYLGESVNSKSKVTKLDLEIQKLAGIFKDNGYPKHIYDSCVNKFLDKKFCEKRRKKRKMI